MKKRGGKRDEEGDRREGRIRDKENVIVATFVLLRTLVL